MRIFTTWHDLTDTDRGASAAIGNFDGVHLGHQAVIDIARAESARSGSPLGIVTFEPHPRQAFAPGAPPFRLMNAESRAHRLDRLGVKFLYQLEFGPELYRLTPKRFARDILAGGLGLSHAVVGEDFRFGRARAGNARDLQAFGREFGFRVSTARLVEDRGAEVSSTAIRRKLAEGKPRDAAAMLGHWHRIDGPVLHGDRRGKALGYPTANMSIMDLHPPKFGVYAVTVDVLDGPHRGIYAGAASIGVRPMFGANPPNLETHIFDFDGDLYGTLLSVALVEYLRPELKFDGIAPLIEQMSADCARARRIIADLP